jgi:hypothetical protein
MRLEFNWVMVLKELTTKAVSSCSHLPDPLRFESVDDNEKWGCRLRFTVLRQPFSNINIAFSWKNVAVEIIRNVCLVKW